MPEELTAIRIKEAQDAAKLIGAKEYINLGIDDLAVDNRDEVLYKRMIDVIRYAKPDVVLTHAGKDYMRDHDGKDILETTRAAAMFRGELSKVKYAEAFLRCDHALRMTTSRMLP